MDWLPPDEGSYQARALTANPTGDLSVHGTMSGYLSHTGQASVVLIRVEYYELF